MRPLLLLAVLLPSLVPAATADHPPSPEVQSLVAGWKRSAEAAVAGGSGPLDHGMRTQAIAAANRSAASGVVVQAAIDIAALHAFGHYLNMTKAAPVDNGTAESRRAQRLWWLNESARMHGEATADVAAAVERLRPYRPTTTAGVEWGILAARLAMAAGLALGDDFDRNRQRMEGFTPVEPDTTTETFRSAAFSLVRFTEGASIMAALADSMRERGRAADAAGGVAIRAEGWDALIAEITGFVERPSTTGPNQLPHAGRAATHFREGEPLMGMAGYLLFDELRRFHGIEFRLGRGSLNATGLAQWRTDATARVHEAAGETGTHGFPGLLLLDALATEATGANSEVAISRLDAAHDLHLRTLRLTAAEGTPFSTGTVLLLAGVAGLLLVGWVLVRRR